jgi:ABC-type glycerol-3-phosphate transport system substrate-binding protein
MRRALATLTLAGLLVLASCGGDESGSGSGSETETTVSAPSSSSGSGGETETTVPAPIERPLDRPPGLPAHP